MTTFLKIGKIGHDAWAIAFAKCSKLFKNESSLKCVKNDCKSTLESSCAKNGFKKHWYWYYKNENFLKIGKIGPNAGAIAFRKCLNWFKNKSSIKRLKNDCRSTFKLFCAINGFKKHLIFQKKKKTFLKIGKIGHNAWAIAFAKW